MSRDLSVFTVIVISAILIIFFTIRFIKNTIEDHSYEISKALKAIFKFILFLIKRILFITILIITGRFFYYFIYGGFFGESILAYALSIITPILLSILIFKKKNICFLIGHKYEMASYTTTAHDTEYNVYSEPYTAYHYKCIYCGDSKENKPGGY